MKRKELTLFCLIFLFLPVSLLSQLAEQVINAHTDKMTIEEEKSPHALYSGLGYGSNMVYLGSTISQDHNYEYASLSYGLKDEFYASLSGFHLSGWRPFIAFYSLSLNYSHTINSWFDYSLGLYRYQVSPSLSDTLFSGFFYGDITIGFDWRLIYTKVTVGALPGNEGGAFIQVRNSRYFETPEFMHKKALISFDPNINLLMGPLITTEITNGGSNKKTHPRKPWDKGKGNNTTTTTYTRSFGLMEVDIGLPVALNTPRFTFEAEGQYIIPLYTNPEYPGAKGFVFLISGYFRIF